MSDATLLVLATSAKLFAEIALLALLGQGVVGLLAGPGRDRNPFYCALRLVGRPWVLLARRLTPAVVLDRHLPLVVFLLLLMVWGAATVAKIDICLRIGVDFCRANA